MALGRTVSELEHTMSYAEMQEWISFYNAEPFQEDRQEIQLAMMMSVMAASFGNKIDPTEFMITGKKPKKKNTVEELSKHVKTIFGGGG